MSDGGILSRQKCKNTNIWGTCGKIYLHVMDSLFTLHSNWLGCWSQKQQRLLHWTKTLNFIGFILWF